MGVQDPAQGSLVARSTAARLIRSALAVRSADQAEVLWEELEEAGANHQRPVGDRWGNRGLFTAAGGNFDHKLVELVTNMHDSVILRRVLSKTSAPHLDYLEFLTLYPGPKAAADSIGDTDDSCLVEIHEAGAAASRHDRTLIFRDEGIGMTSEELPSQLFRVGSSHKDGVLWLSGAFGRGGLTVLPNCHSWVVVSRKDPSQLPNGTADHITLSVVRWLRVGNRQTLTAVYQTASPWEADGDSASPLALPAESFPEFEPGTYIVVVGFRAEGIWVSRLGDEKSFDTVIDTRLYDPPITTLLRTPALAGRESRTTRLRGLRRRIEGGSSTERKQGEEGLPFLYRGVTHLLPVRFTLFPKGDNGSRRRFVAKDHALVLTSNGQVHAHWPGSEFRQRTTLPKLADNIFVVVETDALPLDLRTTLFTADRTELLRNPEAVRLEQEVVSFLNDWSDLRDANNTLIREAIQRSNADRSTMATAGKISRALGLSPARPIRRTDRGDRPPEQPRDLHPDPTELNGPTRVVAQRGRTKGLHFTLDSQDGFIPRRCSATVTCSSFDIDPAIDVTVGELRNGRLRVSVAIPADAEPGEWALALTLADWSTTRGGLGPSLEHTVTLEIRDETAAQGPEREDSAPSDTPSARGPLALLWSSHEHEDTWTPLTVGAVEEASIGDLVALDPAFSELGPRDMVVPLLRLNEDFSFLKAYVAAKAQAIGDEGVRRTKDRYAVGVGVQLFLMDALEKATVARGESPVDAFTQTASVAAARGVLAVMPAFDQLASDAGLDEY